MRNVLKKSICVHISDSHCIMYLYELRFKLWSMKKSKDTVQMIAKIERLHTENHYQK